MCGIVACRGSTGAVDFLTAALRRLEHRGYDAAGIAVTGISADRLVLARTAGRVASLPHRLAEQDGLPGLGVGIGHTRWATGGDGAEPAAPSNGDCTGEIAVAHHGSIDNVAELAAELRRRGHAVRSGAEAEVVAHLVEEGWATTGSLRSATTAAVRRLRGTWALAVVAGTAGEVVLASHRSPLVVGTGAGGCLAASDVTALAGACAQVKVLGDGDVVVLGDEPTWFDADGRQIPPRSSVRMPGAAEDVERGAYEDFTEKEMAEQPAVVAGLLERLLPGVADGALWTGLGLPRADGLRFVACGSSLHAAQVAARTFGILAGLPAETVIASEFDELPGPKPADGVLTVAVSQSGETPDVLHALEEAGGPVLAVTNRPHSSLARRSDAVVDIGAGPQIGVAATKTFTAQVVACAALALAYAAATDALDRRTVAREGLRLGTLPGRLEAVHADAFPVAVALAEELAGARSCYVVSRGAGLPYAAEGARKLQEIAHRPAVAVPAGELPHGAIALIEQGTPVLLLEGGDPPRLAAAAAELGARGARVIRVGSGPADPFPVLCGPPPPWGPLESVLAFQHLARCLSAVPRRDTGQPHDLAQSVTAL